MTTIETGGLACNSAVIYAGGRERFDKLQESVQRDADVLRLAGEFAHHLAIGGQICIRHVESCTGGEPIRVCETVRGMDPSDPKVGNVTFHHADIIESTLILIIDEREKLLDALWSLSEGESVIIGATPIKKC